MKTSMKKRRLGRGGPEVSAIGLGCMGMSEFYGPSDDEKSRRLILEALESGITMLDTSDTYGLGHNESLIADALKEWKGDAFIATKFGIVRKPGEYKRSITGRPEYVRQAADASLKRLRREVIDLYYIHRIDVTVPIEETVGVMADLVKEGKVRWIGLSEPSAKTIRKGHAVHPLAAVQSEFSLWTRHVEEEILPTLRELGIGFVAYSPLGRGFLTGALDKNGLDPSDFRHLLPRLQRENYDHNLALVEGLKELAAQKSVTPAQLALAWVLHKGDDIVPIPGTRRPRYLKENIDAAGLHLDESEIASLESIFTAGAVKGNRYPDAGMAGING
jgi:aryl-alcohol dehydrogenase-like predicted oxidoreductase